MLKNNKNTIQKLVVGILLALCSIHLGAQEVVDPNPLTVTQALQQENIAGQFDYIINKSNRFQEFKVVKRTFLDKLKENTLDSLRIFEEKIISTNAELANQKTTIADLEKTLADTNQKFDIVTQEKDNISFLGIAFTKSGYKSLMWGISGGLLAFLLLFVYKFKNSNIVTVTAKTALAETEAEFEEHRRKALEREQKLNRKLQDEINKQRNKTT